MKRDETRPSTTTCSECLPNHRGVQLKASVTAVDNFSDDVASLWCRQIPVLDVPPDPLTFLRDYVSKSVPCIIRNAVIIPGINKEVGRTLDDLVELCSPSQELTVDVTPDGHGDCIRTVQLPSGTNQKMFVKPDEKQMTFGEFRTMLRSGQRNRNFSKKNDAHDLMGEDGRAIYSLQNKQEVNSNGVNDEACPLAKKPIFKSNSPVPYYSRQNDCLRNELRPLFEKNIFPQTFAFAEEAFGTGPPDAINLWIGDERAASSIHKDHYENMFHVVSGQKIFTLCPPADVPFLYENEFDSGVFSLRQNATAQSDATRCDGSWCVIPDYDKNDNKGNNSDKAEVWQPSRVRWIEANVASLMSSSTDSGSTEHNSALSNKYPLLSRAHPVQIHVNEGETLYLPALWFHHVTQTCETVGINYWYDMNFDSPLWCYFNFLQQLTREEKRAAIDDC